MEMGYRHVGSHLSGYGLALDHLVARRGLPSEEARRAKSSSTFLSRAWSAEAVGRFVLAAW